MSIKHIQVAVGIIVRDENVFITLRANDVHQGGKWEFPGGKVEAGEDFSQALARELHEEVGVVVKSCETLLELTHDYPEKRITLAYIRVDGFSGEPHGAEGQTSKWHPIATLDEVDFPEANRQVVALLQNRGDDNAVI